MRAVFIGEPVGFVKTGEGRELVSTGGRWKKQNVTTCQVEFYEKTGRHGGQKSPQEQNDLILVKLNYYD